MRTTTVTDKFTYGATHLVGSVQHVYFQEEDEGPFDLSLKEYELQKLPRRIGVFRTRKKTGKELLTELKEKGFEVRGHYSVEQIENYAKNYDIHLEIREEIVKPGWVGANKGLMQVLWERGFINEAEITKYSLEDNKSWKDEQGKVKEEFHFYLLRKLLVARSGETPQLLSGALLYPFIQHGVIIYVAYKAYLFFMILINQRNIYPLHQITMSNKIHYFHLFLENKLMRRTASP